jgi:serine/threonine protein kinase
MAERDNRLTERAKRRVGTILSGKWSLERLIGVGGMAAVYVGVHRNKKRAAIKILHTELSVDPDVQSRFLREGYVANSVGHPGAVRVDDDDETDDGAAYLVMELLDGESIERRWLRKNKRLPLHEVLWIGDRLLNVLDAAHTRGIVHRDIKPENLFLTYGGELKVLDFGIARLRDSNRGDETSTQTGKSMGTPAYMAPEQARGRWNEVDQRTDLWAVGATLYALLTGRPVHEAETVNEALGKAMNEPARPIREHVPSLPDAIGEVIDRALEFQKRRRFSTARDMLDALRAASHDIEVTSPALTRPHSQSTFRGVKVSQVPRTGGWRYGFLVAAVLGLVGAGAVVAIRAERREQPLPTLPSDPRTGAPRPEIAGPSVTPAETDDVVELLETSQPTPSASSPPQRRGVGRVSPGPSRPEPVVPTPPPSLDSSPAPSASSDLSTSCTPPYYLDERGIKRFRPECL